MKALYRKNHYCGPGGLKCYCCHAIPGTLKENKQFLNRMFRRNKKIVILNDIEL